MGLRAASVRRPNAEVMAPALTDTTQTQNFNLPTKGPIEIGSPINEYEKDSYCVKQKQVFGDFINPFQLEVDNALTLVSAVEKIELNKCLNELNSASESNSLLQSSIMSISPSHMGDQETKMGIQKTALDVSSIHKERLSNDMDQLFNNLPSDNSPEAETVSNTSDLNPNVEDIMNVFKCIDGGDRVNNTSNDLNSESEEIFPMPVTDLTNNLSSFEKELLENVDVMNITIEDQQDELDSADKQKESQANEIQNQLIERHLRLQRRLDFLRRRSYKIQSRLMGQHISGEIVGVFENVQRSIKKPKELDMSKDDALLSSLTNLGPSEKLKPISYGAAKTFLKKLEMTSLLQASTSSKQRHGSKYFGSGSLELPTFRNTSNGAVTIPPLPRESKTEMQKVVSQLKSQLSLVQEEVDSEATESSSGGESCDEMQTYSNPHQQYLSVQKRALWKYSTERAVIAARWTWLQAQIADHEYRIRQYTDFYKQVRANKCPVQLGGDGPPPVQASAVVNGYRGQLPGGTTLPTTKEDCEDLCPEFQCARTRPLVNFKKRKLLQVAGLHVISKRAARPSTMRCGCVGSAYESVSCALCTGRMDPTHPRDPPDTLGRAERVALLDPSFHPVFSFSEDISQNIHLEAIMKTSEWQQRSIRMKTVKVIASKPERLETKSLEHRTKKLDHRKKYGRLLKHSTMSAFSTKLKNKIRGRKPSRLGLIRRKRFSSKETGDTNSHSADGADEEVESIGNNSNAAGTSRSLDSPSSSPLLQMQSISGLNKRNRVQSYDIDNIVIPYSVAASTRVEKLQYKEILTPKWRIAEQDYDSLFDGDNGTVKDTSQDSDIEDLSEEAVIARHDRSEIDEKKRFLSYMKLPLGYGRSRSHKRTDSRAESSGANTPDPMSPHNADHQDSTNSPLTSPPATPLSMQADDSASLPSIAVMRRRTMSQSRFGLKDRDSGKDDVRCASPEAEEAISPYERRTFPVDNDTYHKMLEAMPENHQFQTNARSQDSTVDFDGTDDGYHNLNSPDTESTESAIGDCEEDPNDPEWIDMERANRERYKR